MSTNLVRGTLDEHGYTVLTPDGWTRHERLPLILVLHGANSSADVLAMMQPIVDETDLPRALVACLSTPTVGGFYLGPWERLVAERFPAHLAGRFDLDDRIALLGSSMGGYGALRIAFADPARFAAVAAVSPALLTEDPAPRNTLGVLARFAEQMRPGDTIVHRLRANAAAIRAGNLPILLRCGDHDVFNMHDGAERLHRELWDLDIAHDYHLVGGADHLGPEATASLRAAFAFVGEALRSGTSDRALDQAWLDWQASGKVGDPPRFDPFGPSASTAVRVMMADELAEAARQDPAAARRYGPIP